MYLDNWNGIGTGDFGFCTLSIDNKEFSQSKSEIRISNSANQIEPIKLSDSKSVNRDSNTAISDSERAREREREI